MVRLTLVSLTELKTDATQPPDYQHISFATNDSLKTLVNSQNDCVSVSWGMQMGLI